MFFRNNILYTVLQTEHIFPHSYHDDLSSCLSIGQVFNTLFHKMWCPRQWGNTPFSNSPGQWCQLVNISVLHHTPKHGNHHFANRWHSLDLPDSQSVQKLPFHVCIFHFLGAIVSCLTTGDKFQKKRYVVARKTGHMQFSLPCSPWKGSCDSSCIHLMSTLLHIPDTVPHDKFKSCISSFTITHLFSSITCSMHVLFSAIPTVCHSTLHH